MALKLNNDLFLAKILLHCDGDGDPMRRDEEKKQTILERNLSGSRWANGYLPHGFSATSSFYFLFIYRVKWLKESFCCWSNTCSRISISWVIHTITNNWCIHKISILTYTTSNQNINNFKIALVLGIHNLNIVRLILSKNNNNIVRLISK